MSSFQFLISPALLSGLAGLIPGEKSPLSPLNIPNPPVLDTDERAELITAGVLDNAGLVETARLLLAALSESPSFARLRLSAPGGYLDEAIHFTGEGANTVGISNTPDGLVVSSPGGAESILSRVVEFTGSSTRALPAWSIGLPAIEMLALAALLDMRRKAVLRAIIDQQPVVLPPGDPQAVLTAIQSMWGNPQWLTAAIQSIAGIATLPTLNQIQSGLAGSADRQLAWPQGGNFMPAPEAITVIDRFLLIGNILTLDAGNSNLQDAFALTRHSWLQAGIAEMLHLNRDGEKVTLEVVTPAAALEKIRIYMTVFDAVPAPPLQAVALALVIQAGLGTGQVFPLVDETVLGRSDQASVRILDSRASRRHAVVRKLSQGYQLSDAGSTNGTYLNGQFLTTPSWLHEGDLIAIGETQIKVIRAGETPPEVESDRTVFAHRPAPIPMPEPPAVEPPAPPAPPELAVILMPAPEPPADSSLPRAEEEISQLTTEPLVEPAPPADEVSAVLTAEPPAPEPPVELPAVPVEMSAVLDAEPPTLEQQAEPAALPDEVSAVMPAEPPAPQPQAEPESPPAEPVVESQLLEMPTGASETVEPVNAPPLWPPETLILPEQPPEAEPVRCVRCHEPLQPGDWVCRHCGQPVNQPLIIPPPAPVVTASPGFCPNCGNPTNPGARFCGACGYRLME